MTKLLKFDLPSEFNDEDIEDYFRENVDDLRPAMDLDVGQGADHRIQIDDVEIENVELESDSIFIEFIVEFSAYYGCDDANFSDDDQRAVTGKRIGNTFIFEEHVYPERPSPSDEL